MANEIVQTVPYSFDEIYNSLIEKLGNDAPYEGSNLAILMTSMSYLVSMLNVNTAKNLNEMFLPLAKKRENVLEGARLLGYEPSKKVGYRYMLTLALKNDVAFADKVSINKYAKFLSGTNTYYYMKDETLDLYGSAGETFVIEVIEGDLKKFSDDASLIQAIGTEIDLVTGYIVPTPYIDIPYTDVDDNGIEVFIDYVDYYGHEIANERWTKSEQFMVDMDTQLDKKFMRFDDIDYKTPRIYFKYAGIGNVLAAGTTVKCNILISKGSLGICDGTFTIADPDIAAAIDVSGYNVIAQGADDESIASVQRNAPLFFNTANRVITAGDYESFCNRDARIKVTKAWGGEEEYPVRPGELWFTFLPETYTRSFAPSEGNVEYNLNEKLDTVNTFLEESEIRSNDSTAPGIWDTLDYYRIPTMQLHNRHPIFLNCEFDISILKYNITQSKAVTHQEVFNVIDDYFKETDQLDSNGNALNFIEKFDAEFFISSLIKRMDEYLTDTSGFMITMNNYINIFDKNLSKESYLKEFQGQLYQDQELNLAHADLFIQFYKPFEDIFDEQSGNLLYNRLPQIDTTEFLANNISGSLTVDWSTLPAGDLKDAKIIEADILHGTDKVGVYRVHNESKKFITINLFIQDDTDDRFHPSTGLPDTPVGVYAISTLRRSDFISPQILNVNFYSPNFKVFKNTIPRLTKVKFN